MSMQKGKLGRHIQVCTGISQCLQMLMSPEQRGMARWEGMKGRYGSTNGWEARTE